MGKRDWWQRSLNGHFRLLERKHHAIEQRQRIEDKSIEAQKKQTLEQQEKTFERIRKAGKTFETIDDSDMLERKKIAKELTWRAKWNARRAKFNTRARKYSQPIQETRARPQLKG